jgi:amino acid transporter
MELASVGLIVILAIGVFAKLGFHIYTSQMHLQGMTGGGFRLGLVVAIFCFVGFESATALGEEAKNPLRTIPTAVVMSCLIVGFFYTIMSLVEVGAFSGYKLPLDQCNPPFDVMCNQIGMNFLAPLLGIGALISGLGCVLASLNAGSRVMFAMGRHGIFHTSVGGAHKQNETPHVAVTLAMVTVLIATLLMFLRHWTTNDVLTVGGMFATFGFLLVYILISIAAPVYRARQGKLTATSAVISVLAVSVMVLAVIGSFAPDLLVHNLPYTFVGYILVGILWMVIQRNSSSGVVQKIEQDLEQIGARFGEAKGIVAEAQGQSMPETELLP